ncbi:MAG: alginate lyase family protein [Hyphomicrobiaceae bacterium]|nr:alginate lyase family protein [Hyphomicrobiaceae bacterium]
MTPETTPSRRDLPYPNKVRRQISAPCAARILALAVVALTVTHLVTPLPVAAAPQGCAPPPPTIVDLHMARPYDDVAGTTANDALKARHAAEAAPLKAFLTAVTRSADDAMRARSRTPTLPAGYRAACGLSWIAAWARGGALLGRMATKQAEYERKWDMTGIALAYLKLRSFASKSERAAIEPWLLQLANATRRFFDSPGHKRNNHWYWQGLGLGAVALATDTPAMWTEAHAIYRDALADIADDGTLPHEIARGRRALHYHVFAATPLVVLAELAARRGEDWYAEAGGRLHRLVETTRAGLADPRSFSARAGVPQEHRVSPGSGWMQLYDARFAERSREAPHGDALVSRPGHRWLGGDVRLLP